MQKRLRGWRISDNRLYMGKSPSIQIRREALIPLLKDPDEGVRQAAAQALEQLDSAGCLEEVLNQLKKGKLGEKVQAIYSLGRIGGEKVLGPLVYCAKRTEEDIKSAAIEVLGELAHPKAVPVLIEKLSEPNTGLRAKAIAALGNYRDPSLAKHLVPFLDANDGLVEAEAALALAKAGEAAQEGKLIELLKSPYPNTRQTAARALGELRV